MAAKKKKVPEKKDAGTPRPKRSLRDGADEVARVDLAKYPVIFESVPLGITLSDKAGNIINCNRMAEQLLGLPKKDQLSRQIDGREWHIIRPYGEFQKIRGEPGNHPPTIIIKTGHPYSSHIANPDEIKMGLRKIHDDT